MSTAFQPSAFQNNAFQILVIHPANMIDSTVMQLPINCVMEISYPIKRAFSIDNEASPIVKGIFGER